MLIRGDGLGPAADRSIYAASAAVLSHSLATVAVPFVQYGASYLMFGGKNGTFLGGGVFAQEVLERRLKRLLAFNHY